MPGAPAARGPDRLEGFAAAGTDEPGTEVVVILAAGARGTLQRTATRPLPELGARPGRRLRGVGALGGCFELTFHWARVGVQAPWAGDLCTAVVSTTARHRRAQRGFVFGSRDKSLLPHTSCEPDAPGSHTCGPGLGARVLFQPCGPLSLEWTQDGGATFWREVCTGRISASCERCVAFTQTLCCFSSAPSRLCRLLPRPWLPRPVINVRELASFSERSSLEMVLRDLQNNDSFLVSNSFSIIPKSVRPSARVGGPCGPPPPPPWAPTCPASFLFGAQ